MNLTRVPSAIISTSALCDFVAQKLHLCSRSLLSWGRHGEWNQQVRYTHSKYPVCTTGIRKTLTVYLDVPQWIFEDAGNNLHYIKNVRGHYISIEGAPRDLNPVVVTPNKQPWKIVPDSEDPTAIKCASPSSFLKRR